MRDRLIEQYIASVLAEDGDGPGAGADVGGGMYANAGYGVGPIGGPSMSQIFLKPFANAAKVAAGETGKASNRAVAVFRSLGAACTKDAKARMVRAWKDYFDASAGLKHKYADAYAEIDRVTTGNEDFAFVAFMFEPAAFVAATVLPKAPWAAMRLMDDLTGGLASRAFAREMKAAGEDVRFKANEVDWNYEGSYRPKTVYAWAKKHLAALGQRTGRASQEIGQAYGAFSEEIRTMMKRVEQARTPEDISRALGATTAVGGAEIARRIGADQQQAGPVVESALNAMKAAVRQFVVLEIENHIKTAIRSGAPTDGKYVKSYQKLLNDVKELIV